MPTIQELKQKADELSKKEDFQNAFPLYLKIWEQEKNELNGKALVKSYRKASKFSEAYELHKTLGSSYPNSGGIKLERLWLDFSSKIKDWNNDNLLKDAEELLAKTDKYNKFTGSIYNKTILSVIKHYIYKGYYSEVIPWLDKLDFTTLEMVSFKGNPSEYKRYFVHYGDTLINLNIHLEKIESFLSTLNFSGLKHTQFKKYIFEEIKYIDYNGQTQVSRLRLALFLKYFKEEILIRQNNAPKNIYNANKILLVSDLGDFEFCPVSFAINETYQINSIPSWDKDEWLGEKKHLFHRYKEFQKTKNIQDVFKDSSIELSATMQTDFNEIFSSKLILENFENQNKTIYSNPTNTIKGIPDYVFENPQGKRFVVTEKFTKRTSEKKETAFYNDLVKIYAYINELTTLKLDFGYIIYWYWQIDDISNENGKQKKKIRIKAYKKFRVDNISENKTKLASTIKRISDFKQTKVLQIDGDKISHPNKCLHCSVVSNCNHKTGKFNSINLPYNINDLTIINDPQPIVSTTTTTSNDDLPF